MPAVGPPAASADSSLSGLETSWSLRAAGCCSAVPFGIALAGGGASAATSSDAWFVTGDGAELAFFVGDTSGSDEEGTAMPTKGEEDTQKLRAALTTILLVSSIPIPTLISQTLSANRCKYRLLSPFLWPLDLSLALRRDAGSWPPSEQILY